MKLSDFAIYLGAGEPMSGCSLPLEAATDLAKTRCPEHPFCLVSDWILFDLTMTPEQIGAVHSVGQEPSAIYARKVVLDSRGRFQEGDWVVSTLKIWCEDEGLFCTRNTLYILLGNGRRHSLTLTDYLSLI
ncbi:DUF6957 family protein [Pseudomonas rhodesiae]|uniref:DUF6957 family protein n=1 Tax=Pseudomonas rhodesiae TaxID=76760 RepID=UPI003CC6A29D